MSYSLERAFTLFLQPEIRWTAGVLANTDTRSQYRFDYWPENPDPTLSQHIASFAPEFNDAQVGVIGNGPQAAHDARGAKSF